MKSLNRDGVPLLGALPNPRELSVQELRDAVVGGCFVILDTRPDRQIFMAKHLPGALYAPLNANFCNVTGSLIEDPNAGILVISEKTALEETVRRLARLGYDNVKAFAEIGTLYRYLAGGGAFQIIPSISFADVGKAVAEGAAIIDVRNPSEYRGGHLRNAILAPYSRLPERLPNLPKDRRLLVHCGSGQRASFAAAYLVSHGYNVVLIDDLYTNAAADLRALALNPAEL